MLRFQQGGLFCGAQRVLLCMAILSLTVLGYTTDVPDRCHHTMINFRLVADCQGQSHKTVPKVDPTIQVLLLNFNLFSTILNSTWPQMDSLQMLSLGKQLGGSLFVGERAFQNVAGITFLDLGGNMNVTLHPAAFAGLTKLEVLLLDVNGFDDKVLERRYFQDLVSLKRLDLSGNLIQRLRPDPAFQQLRRLSFLQLKLNNIERICGDDLQNLKGRHLALLDLSFNRLLYHPTCTNPFHNITVGTLDISSNPWDAMQVEQFFTSITGTRIQNLKMQYSVAIGSSFGFHNLEDISARTFSGLHDSGTFSLDMSHGFLNELAPSVFSAFPDLHILFLRFNKITEIHDGAFLKLNQLHVLDLSNNLLGELYTKALKSLRSLPLQYLILKSNHIGIVQHDALVGLDSLQILDLQDNALSQVPNGKLPSLQRLMLGHNRIRDTLGIEHLSQNLTHLDLSSNRLSDLGQLWEQLGKIPSLLFLNLSSNHLARCFWIQEGPRHLRELDLSHNNLAGVWKAGKCAGIFHHLERLTVLNLSFGSLKDFPKGLFRGLVSLQTLDLSENLLPLLPEEVFLGLQSLRTLSLRGNSMMTLSPSVFQPLVLLQTLDLQELTLFCHCGLASLQTWLQSNSMAPKRSVAAGIPCVLPTPTFTRVSLSWFLHNNCDV
ncbi:PREDICTED: toll-like receptor 5 [Gekko japonicus]|uniref:Toll-like receptor 5 n=1 Tax=Gekko japonicus TaxID=146911 RepID=A0ABM1JXY4_GEKJA|nr:PREDICTED: toll-like receptor 5 [Gekko japonicus]